MSKTEGMVIRRSKNRRGYKRTQPTTQVAVLRPVSAQDARKDSLTRPGTRIYLELGSQVNKGLPLQTVMVERPKNGIQKKIRGAIQPQKIEKGQGASPTGIGAGQRAPSKSRPDPGQRVCPTQANASGTRVVHLKCKRGVKA